MGLARALVDVCGDRVRAAAAGRRAVDALAIRRDRYAAGDVQGDRCRLPAVRPGVRAGGRADRGGLLRSAPVHHHRDRPVLIGAVGNITGKADINISSMQLARLQPRGKALMILALDEPLKEEQRQEILALGDVYTANLVKL